MKLQSKLAVFLSFATLIQSAALFQISRTHSAVGTFLFMELGQSESFSHSVDLGAAALVCLLSLGLIFSLLKERPKISLYIASAISFWMVVLATATFLNGGSFGARFALFAYAARICMPLIAVAISAQQERAFGVLKIAVAITFITHGIEAWTGHPGFVDYVLIAMDTIFSLQLDESQSVAFLKAVGLMDVVCGLLILFAHSKKLVLWMAFWGLMTASLRVFGFGAQNWAELAIRVSHFALPFALYYYWHRQTLSVSAAK